MVTKRAVALAVALSFHLTAHAETAQPDWAGDSFGPSVSAPTSGREISTEDLVRLRDLSGISMSPDGRRLVFAVYQADPASNRYVQRWFVAPSDGQATPRPLNLDGGQPIPTDIHGLPYAYIPRAYALWSPDGRSVAMRRMVDRRIELWVVDVADNRAVRVADGTAQVSSFAWTHDGVLLFRTGYNPEAFDKALEQEASHGWLLDNRVQLYASRVRPTPPNCDRDPNNAGCSNQVFAFVRAAGTRIATSEEEGTLQTAVTAQNVSISTPTFRADGRSVTTEAVDKRYESAALPIRQIVTDAGGFRRCQEVACRGMYFQQVGWSRSGRSVWFLKLESSLRRDDGVPRDRSGLYEWDLRTGKVRTILQMPGVVSDCHVAGVIADCVAETPTSSPKIVSINLESKQVRTVADPNPWMKTKVFPRVREITIRDKEGNIGFAQVVYPNNYVTGKKYPLVVTQYISRGFLRGQVGNEYPIYPLAAAGMVVMSVEWSRFTRLEQTEGFVAWNKFYAEKGRDLVWSSMEGAIDELIGEGLVDPKRMALTGLSGGAENVHYVLQRSGRFSAAIASSAMQDLTFFALASEAGDRELLMRNFSSSTVIPPAGNKIYDLAWSNKPEKLVTPLLINVGEYEALVGFEGVAAIKHAGGPIEVRIFPDEQHIKYHPAAIEGVYDNNMRWLRFWLLDSVDADPSLAAEYARWRTMRDRLKK